MNPTQIKKLSPAYLRLTLRRRFSICASGAGVFSITLVFEAAYRARPNWKQIDSLANEICDGSKKFPRHFINQRFRENQSASASVYFFRST